MKSRVWLAILSVIIFLSCWGCGSFGSAVSPSPPLGDEPIPSAVISAADVISATNTQRITRGLQPLAENQKLDLAANFKMRDMFVGQYFGHSAPDNTYGLSELLVKFDYRYALAGENLALGNYKNADELVSAWMVSPSHRANILNNAFQDIGVATGYDVFMGRRKMIFVQIFGTLSRQ